MKHQHAAAKASEQRQDPNDVKARSKAIASWRLAATFPRGSDIQSAAKAMSGSTVASQSQSRGELENLHHEPGVPGANA